MKSYQYQETLIINVEVYANSKKEAQEKVSSALAIAFDQMQTLDQIEKDIRDNSFDTLGIEITNN
jgi:hypothetical protein